MQNKVRSTLGLFLLCMMCLAAGCGSETPAVQTDTVNTAATTTVTEVPAADTTAAPATEETTAAPETETAAPETTVTETTATPETTTAPASESEESSTAAESTVPAADENKPEFVNPLTGLSAEQSGGTPPLRESWQSTTPGH